MLEMEQSEDDLQAAIIGQTLFVRVQGRGSFRIAAPLKQFVQKTCSQKPITIVAIDVKDCIGMDSTFMGVLAGLSGRLKKSQQTLELLNVSDKNQNLLSTLGVDQVLDLHNDNHGHEIPNPEPVEMLTEDPPSKKEIAETALHAHKELVEINEENRPRFKSVIEFLKDDVDRLT